MLDGDAAAKRFDQLEQHALLRRSPEDAVAMNQRWELTCHCRDASRAPGRGGRRLRGERARQHRAQHYANRYDVVLGDPAREREHPLADDRQVVG